MSFSRCWTIAFSIFVLPVPERFSATSVRISTSDMPNACPAWIAFNSLKSASAKSR
ncbi:hypothetical protein VARIO8X_70026 [Burkholderiales bacterium 8X]|nr:hypothetical protein VARIO8X_70026 [Burkholderiales bacterium 8X]